MGKGSALVYHTHGGWVLEQYPDRITRLRAAADAPVRSVVAQARKYLPPGTTIQTVNPTWCDAGSCPHHQRNAAVGYVPPERPAMENMTRDSTWFYPSDTPAERDPGVEPRVPIYELDPNGPMPVNPVQYGTKEWDARAQAIASMRYESALTLQRSPDTRTNTWSVWVGKIGKGKKALRVTFAQPRLSASWLASIRNSSWEEYLRDERDSSYTRSV